MEREAPLFLEARTWKVLETILDRKSSPMLSKFLGKSSKNRSQNLPKSSPRRSKIEVWRGFCWISLSDPKLSPLFSAPGGRLGASWERLGRVSGSSWGRLGSLGAPWKRLEGVVGRLGSVLELLAYTPWKSTPKTIDFTSEDRPPDLQKSSPHCSESMILQILRFSRFPWIWALFWC